MNELVEQLAAWAGVNEALANEVLANEVLANEVLAKQVLAKKTLAKENLAKRAPAKKALAKKAVGKNTVAIILGSLRSEGAADKIQVLIDNIAGAEAASEAPSGAGGRVGLLGDRLKSRGGKLVGLGLSMGGIQSAAGELFKFGRDRVAADRMGEIIAGTPGLRQFA
jgi:hypothetical protein